MLSLFCIGTAENLVRRERGGGGGIEQSDKKKRYLVKGVRFISNRQRPRKEGTLCALELARIEPTPPAPKEQGIPALTN
jgi:hypothetical protein